MGFFDRKKEEALVAVDPVLVEPPSVGVGELEKMVHSVYKEKLELEKKLANSERRIKELEERATKLSAAEEFARQSESERKLAESKASTLKERVKSLEKELESERARVSVRDVNRAAFRCRRRARAQMPARACR